MNAVPNLTGVRETMLWRLYIACSKIPKEFGFSNPFDYDFERSSGHPDPAHAVRGLESDCVRRDWPGRLIGLKNQMPGMFHVRFRKGGSA